MKKFTAIMIAFLLLAVSCKKTVESEQKAWEVNLRIANQLAYEYPNFDTAIKEQIKTAEAVWAEAAALSDEKAKIQKMADANARLRAPFVRSLDEIKSLRQSIRSKSTDLRGMKMEYNELMGANQAISNGERAIFDAEIKIKAPVNSKSDADALTTLVVSDLKLAESNIEKIMTTVRNREAEQKKVAQKTEEVKKAAEEKKTVEAQPIKCGYCGTLNPAGSTTCKSCGAALGK